MNVRRVLPTFRAGFRSMSHAAKKQTGAGYHDWLVRFNASPAGAAGRLIGFPQPPVLQRPASPAPQKQSLSDQKLFIVGGNQARGGALERMCEARGSTRVTSVSDADCIIIDCQDTVPQFRDLKSVMGGIKKGSKLVLLSGCTSASDTSPLAQASAAAESYGTRGLTKSLAKELGVKGICVNHLLLSNSVSSSLNSADPSSAASRIAQPLAYFLSPDCAFITAQTVRISNQCADFGREAVKAQDRTAIVTGAAQGIGRAITLRLIADGVDVMAVDRPECQDKLDKLVTSTDGPGTVHPHVADLAKAEAATNVAEAVRELFGQVDIVVHNAGVTRDRSLKKMKDEEWNMVLDINWHAIQRLDTALVGDFVASQSLGLDLHDLTHDFGSAAAAASGDGELAVSTGSVEGSLVRPGGSVVVMSSINGIAGAFGQTNYSYTKAALIRYAAAMAPYLGRMGVNINAVAPGFIETEMTKKMPFVPAEVGRRANCFSQGGLPADIASAVAMLTSPEAQGVTGGVLRVCGGNIVGE